MNLSNEKILHNKLEDIEYIQFKKLLEFDNVVHAFTLKNNLNFIGEAKDISTEKICNALKISDVDAVFPSQTHSDNVKSITDINDEFENTDGIISNIKDLPLFIRVADCIAIMLFDPIKNVIGNVHSGWKGTLNEISKKAILKMSEEYGSNFDDIICFIAPSIRSCCFEVDADVKDLFASKFSYMDGIIQIGKVKDNKQKYFIDTVLINKLFLISLGIKESNIIDCEICTMCTDSFHSYRRDKDLSGRSASIICLKK